MAYMSQENKKQIAEGLKKVIPATWKWSLAVIKREKGVWFTPEGQDDVMGGYKPKRLV